MIKSRALISALVVLAIFSGGCALRGDKKPLVLVDQANSIPADIPSQFFERYERFLTGKEIKEFKKLLTDEERQVFIDKFWTERDIDPTTLENEYKEKIDERIDDIANERFFGTSVTTGLLFSSNRGFRGDMARVYLLHGEPDAIDVLEGRSFVDLMLWLYINPENGNILYAFLFYQKGSYSGEFYLFSQDTYQLDPCGAVNEVMESKDLDYFGASNQVCPPEVELTYREIQSSVGKGGILDGYVFSWALLNFSQDSSNLQGAALGPPKPASEIAKDSKAGVTGEASKPTGVIGTDYIFASCERCNSFIPAELQLGEKFVLSVRRSDIDWRVTGDEAQVELKVRVVLENVATNTQSVIENVIVRYDSKNLILTDASSTVDIMLLTVGEVAKIPAGAYRVSVYVKNVTSGLMTKKYNAWSENFRK